MTVRNPKQEGSNLWDCRPQVGRCPMNCNQCFYNRPNAFYCDINEPQIPDPSEVGDGIVRMNCGHDSNLEKDLVLATAKQYKHVFFNTAITNLDFPGPVVFTANRREEADYFSPINSPELTPHLDNLMFVRLRVSPTNLHLVESAVRTWAGVYSIPIVLTFMAYYDKKPPGEFENLYVWKTRHINEYWCPTPKFMAQVLGQMRSISRLVTMCGTLESNYCRDCRNCETYYWQTHRRLNEKI